MRHITSLDALSFNHFDSLFREAETMRGIKHGIESNLCRWTATGCENRVMATLFFEPSTRTRLSFEIAMKRLGGSVVSATESKSLSVTKGESFAETIRTVGLMADVLVVRSPEPVTEWNLHKLRIPVINAGDGHNNHPTQALLDAYTVWRHYRDLGKLRGDQFPFPTMPVKHLIVGDLDKSRAIRAYLGVFGGLNNHEFFLYDSTGRKNEVSRRLEVCSPFRTKTELTYLDDVEEVESCIKDADIVYLNRVQKERYPNLHAVAACTFALREDHLKAMKPTAIVLNPGPCQEELPSALLDHPLVKVYDQVENGMYVRMALLRHLLTGRLE